MSQTPGRKTAQPTDRPTYDFLSGRIDRVAYESALADLDRRYAWIPERRAARPAKPPALPAS
jgi:hypothetical protein